MLIKQNIGFIGGGAMGEAIMRGLLEKGVSAVQLAVSDPISSRLNYLAVNLGVKTYTENKKLVEESDVIVLAIKPQNMVEALAGFAGEINANKLVVSIIAGASTVTLENLLPEGTRLIRVMPNTPAQIGAGTTVITPGTNADEKDLDAARAVFECVGTVDVLPEKQLNAVTGLSGSGPAYVYILIEALADGGVLAGLPRDIALKLAAGTVEGAALMVKESKLHPGQLKDTVASPAGTTIYGLLEMEKAGVRGTIMETVLAAAKRAKELE